MPVNVNEWQKEHPWEPSGLSHPAPVPLVKPADLFNPMLTIADVMSPEVPACTPDTSAAEAARILRDTASSAVFVISGERELAGIVTDRALALAAAERGGKLEQVTVRDLMKPEVPTVSPEDRLGVLLDRFADAGAAVVDRHRHLKGVVRWIDLLGHLSERALGKLVVRLFEHGHSEASELAR